jgi:hypothetical protein
MTRKHRGREQPWESHRRERLERSSRAGRLADRFPHVRSLWFEFTFTDYDSGSQTQRSYTRGPEHSASFEEDCIYHECVCGGYDLTQSVTEMLRRLEPQCQGTLTCPGWQDQQRYRRYGCYGRLDFVVRAEYDAGSSVVK